MIKFLRVNIISQKTVMFCKKGYKLREMAFLFLFFLFLVLTPFSSINYVKTQVPSEQHPANALWMEPSTVMTTTQGDKFNVTIWVNLTQKSFAWQIKLFFNTSYFSPTKIGYTSSNTSDFFAEHSVMPIIPRINYEEGYILHGETLLGSDKRDPGYGSLVWIEFNLIDIPPQNHSTLSFSTPYGIDTFVLAPSLDIIPLDTISVAEISISSTTTTTTSISPPPFPDISILILIAIFVVTVVTILVIMRRRRSKKDE